MSDNQPQPAGSISASEQYEPQRPPSVLSERFGVHWTIIGTIVGIVAGVVVAFFFFKLSEQRKQFAYTSPVTSIRIFDSKSASPAIRVLDALGKPITEDVYVTEIVFWNSGNVPIEPSDVREPIKFVLSPVTRIIDLKVTGATRDNIAKFVVSEADVSGVAENDRKAVQILWDHLDPGFGVRFQVTYVGLPSTETELAIALQGYIVNAEGLPVGESNRGTREFLIGSVFGFLASLVSGSFLLLIVQLLLGKKMPGSLTLTFSEILKQTAATRPRRSNRNMKSSVVRAVILLTIIVLVTALAFTIVNVFYLQPQHPF